MLTRNKRKSPPKIHIKFPSSDEDSDLSDIDDTYDDKDISVIKNFKSLFPKLYETFKKTKKIIKLREVTLYEILEAKIDDEKRANLIELYEILHSIPSCTYEYLEARNNLTKMFKKDKDKETHDILSIPFISKLMGTNDEASNFRKTLKTLVASKSNKKYIEEKIEELEESSREDKNKIRTWIKIAMTLPFDKMSTSINLEIKNKLEETYAYLNKNLYGMKNVKERLMIFLNKKLHQQDTKGCNIALIGDCGVGKCHGENTPIIMYNGNIKMVQDIHVGEQLMGDDSTPRNVISLARGKEKMYKIIQDVGDEYVVNESHILSLTGPMGIQDISITEYLKLSDAEKDSLKGYKVGVDFPYKKVPFEPYEIGLSIYDEFCYTYIPHIYKCNTRAIRMQVLAGVLGIDMNLLQGKDISYEIVKKNKNVVDDIIFLARSLGFQVTVENKIYHYKIFIKGQHLLTKIKIEPLEVDDYYGFEIDGNHRYLLGDFTVTHNTSIVQAISKCLEMPFAKMNCGNVNNNEFLLGHDYTYVASRPGEITRCLIRMKSKNGILFFDEYNHMPESVLPTLLHITDFSQNHEFRDNYFPELTQDLSKIWFIYSMNALPREQAVVDRLEVIHVDGYTVEERLHIAKEYIFPKFTKEMNLNNISISDEAFRTIINTTGDKKQGVRNLERHISLILEKSYFFLKNTNVAYEYPWFKMMKKNYNVDKSLVITENIAKEILSDEKKEEILHYMYM